MKILAVKLREIGDTVIWTAALTSLKKAYPDGEIHILTYASNAAVLAHHPAIQQLHLLPDHSRRTLMQRLWRLRAARFDFLLGFNANTSLCRWAWLAGAGKMVLHHHSRTSRPWGSLKVPHAGQLEDARMRDLRVVQALGFAGEPEKPTITLKPKESDWAEALLIEKIKQVGGKPKLPRLLFLPGARHPLHRYPRDLWLPLVEKAAQEGKYQPVVLCDADLSLEWSLTSECERMKVPLIDQARLREFVALISRGDKAIANDSGPSHIAVSFDVETTFLYGPGCSGDFHFYDPQKHPLNRVVVPCRSKGPQNNEPFRFCTVSVCSHHRCLRELAVHV